MATARYDELTLNDNEGGPRPRPNNRKLMQTTNATTSNLEQYTMLTSKYIAVLMTKLSMNF